MGEWVGFDLKKRDWTHIVRLARCQLFEAVSLLYGGLSGFATGLGYNVCLGYIVKWYPDRAGFASSVLLVAYGTGSLIVGTLAKKLIDAVGVLSAFRIIGIVVFVVLAVGAVFIKKPGPDTVLPASKAKKEAQGSTRSYPPRVMLASGVFWVFLLWCVVKSSATMIIVSSAAPIASYFGAPAAMGLIISVTSGGGRMVYGAMHDAKGFVKTSHFNCVVMLAAGGLMLLGNYTRSAVIIIVGLLVAGLASASVSSLTSAFINWMWGPEFYQSNLSWGCLNIMLSSVIGPSVAGFLQDRAPADSYYSSTFWAMMGFCVLSCIVVLILNRMIRRYDPEKRSAGKAEN